MHRPVKILQGLISALTGSWRTAALVAAESIPKLSRTKTLVQIYGNEASSVDKLRNVYPASKKWVQ